MPKVIFIDLIIDICDLHGVYSLSGFMKHHGIDVYFIRQRNYKKILSKISEIKPDLLLYSSVSANVSKYSEFDKIAKDIFRIRSLIGGPGPTFDPRCLDDSTIDAACIGEGEFALVDFINNGFQSTKNVFYKGEEVPDKFYPFVEPDKLPFPDRDIVYREDPLVRNMPSKQFFSGRGCPYECTYCFNHKFNMIFKDCGPVVRKKSVSYLLEEIRFVQKKYPLTNVVFNDDIFVIDKNWFLEFSERFPKEIGLTYTCSIRSNLVDNAIAKALSESNCVAVNWSIESGDTSIRNGLLKRGISKEQILNTSCLLTKYKIPYRIGNLIGLPGESLEQMLETIELNIEAKPSLGFASIFVPFPGLALTQYAIDKGHYYPRATKELPKNFQTKSVMNISYSGYMAIQKLVCLFPIFIRFPVLFYNPRLRRLLFRLPLLLSRVVFHAFFTFELAKLFQIKASFMYKCRLMIRYIQMLVY